MRDRHTVRDEIENVIKEYNMDRSRISEVSKLKYQGIISMVEKKFVKNCGDIHWVNTTGRYNDNLPCRYVYIGDDYLWVEHLEEIIPDGETKVYALFEDTLNWQPKYWVYEMCIPELIKIILEAEGLSDFYIISKKYLWLISENHEDIASFVGHGLKLSVFDTK